ncbi:MAG TPA: hypothetical protein VIY72_02500 [Acidimicrobiales bacterium]
MPDTDAAPPTFPPPRHAITLLGADVELRTGTDLRGWMPVVPHVATASGAPSLAAMGMLLDIVGGTSAALAARPDQVFTADMSVHLLPSVVVDEVVCDVHVRRRGRRTLVQEFSLEGGRGEPVGRGTTTFVVTRRSDDGPDVESHDFHGRQPFWPLGPDEEPARYREELGLRIDGPGEVSIDARWQVANNVGALNGGVQAAMIDESATSLGRVHLAPTAEATDAHIAFLRPGLKGPLRAVATLVGGPAPEGDRLTAEVRLLDAEGTLCTFATTEVVVP